MIIQLHKILDVAHCYDILRTTRWAEGVVFTTCKSNEVVKNGKDPVQKECQHYKCKSCGAFFDDVTDTIFSGSHQGIHRWITVLYLVNLNVSMRQIASELDVSEETAQSMCAIIREGVVKIKKSLILSLAERLRLTNVMSLPGHKGATSQCYKSWQKASQKAFEGQKR